MSNLILNTIMNRGSCRNFSDKKIDEDVINKVLDAGISAPSGGDFQALSIIMISDADKKNIIAELSGQSFVAKAPVVLMMNTDWNRINKLTKMENCPFNAPNNFMDFLMSTIDVGVCAQNMVIAAESMGLKSVYLGDPIANINILKEAFLLPKFVMPMIFLCLGYPKQEVKRKKKYSRDILVHKQSYQNKEDEKIYGSYCNKHDGFKVALSEDLKAEYLGNCQSLMLDEEYLRAKQDFKDKEFLSYNQFFLGVFYIRTNGTMINQEYKSFLLESGFNWADF